MAPQTQTRKRGGGPGGAGRGASGSGGAAGSALEIPDKLYFRIGEVARLCALPAYVLRFWESEFPQLKPHKGGTGQRLYRRRDVEMALRIKALLYDEGYTIAGARQAIKAELRGGKESSAASAGDPETIPASHLRALQKDMRELHALLLKAPAARPPVQAIRLPRAASAPASEGHTEPVVRKPALKPQLLQPPRALPLYLDGLFDDLPPEE